MEPETLEAESLEPFPPEADDPEPEPPEAEDAEPEARDTDEGVAVSGENLDLLDPATLRIEDGPAGLLRITMPDRCVPRAIAVWAFPFTERRYWIGLRDEEDNAVGMLHDSSDLDRDSRAVLFRHLERRYFIPRIQRVIVAREEFGLLTMDVETDRGRIAFTVNNPRENIHWIGPRRILFVDAEENRYEVMNYDELDARSQTMLSTVI